MSTKTINKKTALIQIRVDEEDKKQLEDIFRKLGLTISQAGLLYFKQILLQKRIPFHIALPDSDIENNQSQFRKTQAQLVSKMDEGEIIPDFSEQNARKF